MQNNSGRRFAQGLFEWLAGGGSSVVDSDFDGLSDSVEDANRDGMAGPGETSFVSADSDGDGVPDGIEDTNLNGRVDEGETDPRLLDTDGDGLSDGADPDPLPEAGTPALLAVRPDSGPTEGGTLVELSGRNFPIQSDVWFGPLRSPHVVRVSSERIVASAPELQGVEAGGPMAVRVAHPSGLRESRLDDAFSYTPRTRGRLTLEPLSRVRRAYDGYRGEFSIELDVPNVRLDAVAFQIWIEPGLEHFALDVERSEALAALGRTLTIRRYGLLRHRLYVSDGDPISGKISLGTVHWRMADVPSGAERIQLTLRYPDFRALWGGAIEMEVEGAWVDLRGIFETESPPARRER